MRFDACRGPAEWHDHLTGQRDATHAYPGWHFESYADRIRSQVRPVLLDHLCCCVDDPDEQDEIYGSWQDFEWADDVTEKHQDSLRGELIMIVGGIQVALEDHLTVLRVLLEESIDIKPKSVRRVRRRFLCRSEHD